MFKTPMQTETGEFFIRVRRLRLEAVPDAVAHEELEEVLNKAKYTKLTSMQGGLDALYAMASLVDELWRWDDTFEYRLFGSANRDGEFYVRLDKALFLQCLTFGFRGGPPAPKTAAQYASRCIEYLRRAWGDFKDLAPRGHIPRQKEIDDGRRRGPIALMLAVCACVLVLAGGLVALIGTHELSISRAEQWKGLLHR